MVLHSLRQALCRPIPPGLDFSYEAALLIGRPEDMRSTFVGLRPGGEEVRIRGNGDWEGDFWRFRVGGAEKGKPADRVF